ncbi:MAG: hypothetical protein ACQERE_11650 [Pseudomonadota bacterium]
MNRQPDVIRVLVTVFVIGLLISGITSLAASEEPRLTSGAVQESAQSQDATGRIIN